MKVDKIDVHVRAQKVMIMLRKHPNFETEAVTPACDGIFQKCRFLRKHDADVDAKLNLEGAGVTIMYSDIEHLSSQHLIFSSLA